MGLAIAVGLLADQLEYDEEGAAWHRAVLADLNLLLAEAGEAPHTELEQIPGGSKSWQSYGYAGLHHVRRLAAWLAIYGRLPEPCNADEKAADDATLAKFYHDHEEHLSQRNQKRLLGILRRRSPPFAHLILHSDAEGFYLPRELPHVLFDKASPQREGIGGMVGSAKELLTECQQLAAALRIPPGIDPEAEILYENVDAPPDDGEPWQRLPIETLVITRLMAACEKSLETGAAVVFN